MLGYVMVINQVILKRKPVDGKRKHPLPVNQSLLGHTT